MKNFLRTIFHLVITTLVYLIFNEGAMFTLNQGTLLSGIITVVAFLAYGPVCYYIARKFDFGRWKYVLYIPFINEFLYIVGIYTLPIRTYLPMEDDNYGIGMLLLPLTLIMWIIFLVATLMGIQVRKKTISSSL
jgi:hypothetical protein